MVLSIAAFCIRIYLRSSTFQRVLVFFSYLKLVRAFGLRLYEILMELKCFFFYNMFKEFYS